MNQDPTSCNRSNVSALHLDGNSSGVLFQCDPLRHGCERPVRYFVAIGDNKHLMNHPFPRPRRDLSGVLSPPTTSLEKKAVNGGGSSGTSGMIPSCPTPSLKLAATPHTPNDEVPSPI
jgi:hypothetical protein